MGDILLIALLLNVVSQCPSEAELLTAQNQMALARSAFERAMRSYSKESPEVLGAHRALQSSSDELDALLARASTCEAERQDEARLATTCPTLDEVRTRKSAVKEFGAQSPEERAYRRAMLARERCNASEERNQYLSGALVWTPDLTAPSLDRCPLWTTAVSKEEPERRVRTRCIVKDTTTEFVAYSYIASSTDGFLISDELYRDGGVESSRLFWSRTAPGCTAPCDHDRLLRVVEDSRTTCYAADSAEINCAVLGPGDAEPPSKSFLSSQVNKRGTIRWPYGFDTITTRSLFETEDFCLDPDESGAFSCVLEASEDRSIVFANFESQRVSVGWVPAPDGLALQKVTISSGDIDDCDEMGLAFQSAVSLIKSKYPSVRARKGPAHGSRKCRDYMSEGAVYFSIADSNFEVRVDTFWLDGAYRVYITYHLLPALNLSTAYRTRSTVNKAIDAMGKL